MAAAAVERLSASVGAGAPNLPMDVVLVQDLLNRVRGAAPALPVDGRCSPALLARIGQFQATQVGFRWPDQRVDPFGPTLALLRELCDPPQPLPGLTTPGAGGNVALAALDAYACAQLYRMQFRAKPPGLPQVLAALKADPDIRDVRWAAYMLATVMRETAGTFQSIAEYGRGAGRPYGEPARFTDGSGCTHAHAYYGRGYVQLTWLANYESVGRALGLGDDLAARPERAMDPDIAYRVMSYGMRHGAFTGHRLADHIAGPACDYVNARRIVNGLDAAEEIAANAVAIEKLLRLAMA